MFRPKRLIVASLLIVGLSTFLVVHYSGFIFCPGTDCVDTAAYYKDRLLQQLQIAHVHEPPAWNGTVGDKIIIMAHTNSEDVSWVEKHLPE